MKNKLFSDEQSRLHQQHLRQKHKDQIQDEKDEVNYDKVRPPGGRLLVSGAHSEYIRRFRARAMYVKITLRMPQSPSVNSILWLKASIRDMHVSHELCRVTDLVRFVLEAPSLQHGLINLAYRPVDQFIFQDSWSPIYGIRHSNNQLQYIRIHTEKWCDSQSNKGNRVKIIKTRKYG